MVGGKGKGRRGSIVSVLVREVTEELDAERADAAIRGWLRGEMSDADIAKVEATLKTAEARARAGRAA
jgi:hypothetical protein